MRKSRFFLAGLSLLTAAAVVFLASLLTASAQPADDQERPQRPPEGRKKDKDGDFRPGPQFGQPPFGPMMGGPATMIAHGDFLFVLRGNTLYQVSVKDLKLVKKMTLEEDGFPPFGPDREKPPGPDGQKRKEPGKPPRPPKD